MNLDQTIRSWLLFYHKYRLGTTMWRGVRVLKLPMDLMILHQIIWNLRPNTIVEIGSRFGGSTLFLADMLRIAGVMDGVVISVDKNREDFQADVMPIVVITGDSRDSATFLKVQKACRMETMVIHDGDHHAEHVLADLRMYANLVSIGQYLIVEDTIIDQMTPGDGIGFKDGPLVAVNEFLKTDQRFVRSHEPERYGLSHNEGGYLVRVK